MGYLKECRNYVAHPIVNITAVTEALESFKGPDKKMFQELSKIHYQLR